MFRSRTLLVGLAVAAVVTCLMTPTAPAAKPAPPAHRPAVAAHVQSVGFAFGEYETSTPERAHQAMKDVIALHGNTVRLMIFYKDPMAQDSSVPAASDLQLAEVCNAVQAAQDTSVGQVVIDLILKRWLLPALGDMKALSRYNAAWQALMDQAVACRNGLAPVPVQIGAMIGNEPNSTDFCGYQDPVQNRSTPQTARHQMCAQAAAQLYKYTIGFIQKQYPDLQVPFYILGLSSHSDPLGFVKPFCAAIQAMGLSSAALWNSVHVGFHAYTLSGTTDYLTGYRLAEKVFAVLQAPSCLGPNTQKGFTEGGDESVTDAGDPQYSGSEAPTVPVLPASQIGTAARQELQWAADHGEKFYWHFLIKDESDRSRWQSGVEKPNGDHKPYTNADGSIGSVFDDFAQAYAAFGPTPAVSTAQP